MTLPKYLFTAWPEIAPRLAQPEQVGLFLDFDGTLTRIRRRPSEAHLSAAMRDLLVKLTQTSALAAIVTGRKLSDAKARVDVAGLWYAGDHGYRIASPEGRRFNLENLSEQRRIVRAGRRLTRALASHQTILVDVKSASIAVHYRGAPKGSSQFAERAVREAFADDPELTLLAGKKVWEIMPGDRVDKWTGVQVILRRSKRRPRTLVFIGDDTTDERVFEQMRGITVIVGNKRPTAARFWVRSPGEVARFLKQCLQLWKPIDS